MPDAPIDLSRDAWGSLVLIDSDGVRHSGIEPVRAFPLSDPRRRIALCDESGRERAWVEDLDSLADPIRKIIEEELASNQFLPAISRIERISGESAPSDWDVVTDRGRTRFTLDSEEQIRKLGKDRVLISDAMGLRYEVRDVQALDPASRKLLERYL
jgi:hypothetical protein